MKIFDASSVDMHITWVKMLREREEWGYKRTGKSLKYEWGK